LKAPLLYTILATFTAHLILLDFITQIINFWPYDLKGSIFIAPPFYEPFSFIHAVAQWLRHCATNRKVAGSIPDGVTGIFH
jgi:hypothetical protein